MDKGTEGTEKDKVTFEFKPDTTKPLFSEADIRRIVRNFIEAFLRGAIKIPLSVRNIKKGTYDPLAKVDETENGLIQLIELASGTNPVASPATVELAIRYLYGWIIMLRQKGMMEGTFLENVDFSVRLENVEKLTEKAVEVLDRYSPSLEKIGKYEPVLDNLKTFLEEKAREEEEKKKYR